MESNQWNTSQPVSPPLIRGKAPAVPPKVPAMPSKASAVPPVPLTVKPLVKGKDPEVMKPVHELISFYWKGPSVGTVGVDNITTDGLDVFLKPFALSSIQSTISNVLLPTLPKVILTDSNDNRTRSSSFSISSIFSESRDTLSKGVSTEGLKRYFTRKQNKLFDNNNGLTSSEQNRNPNADNSFLGKSCKKSALDHERIKLIGLAIGGSLGSYSSHSSGASSPSQSSSTSRRNGYKQYRQAILSCDYTIARSEVLCPLLQLLQNVPEEELAAVVSNIQRELALPINAHVPESLILDEYEEADVFLFEMSKIPFAKTRIECMIFEQSFDELFDISLQSLTTLYAALEVLFSKRDQLARLFQLVLQTGNSLNKGSRLGNQSSFSLSTLEKLVEVKSSLDSKIDLLHFIQVHLPTDEASIFSETECAKLKSGANLRSYRVRDEVKDLLDSIKAIDEVLLGEQMTKDSRNTFSHKNDTEETHAISDTFFTRIKKFRSSIESKQIYLSEFAFNVFSSYKNLALYFGDPVAVYPPPKEKATSDQYDIIEFFANFAGILKQHEKDVKKYRLRNRIDMVAGEAGSAIEPITTKAPAVVRAAVVSAAVVKESREPSDTAAVPKIIESVKLSQAGLNQLAAVQKALPSTPSVSAFLPQVPIAGIVSRTSFGTKLSSADLSLVKPPVLMSPAGSVPVVPPLVVVEPLNREQDLVGATDIRKTSVVGLPNQGNPVAPPPRRLIIASRPSGGSTAFGQSNTPSMLSSTNVVLPVLGTSSAIHPQFTVTPTGNSTASNWQYPARRGEASGYNLSHNVFDSSRQSLSNTVNRVAHHLMSPNKNDNAILEDQILFKGTRKNTASVLPPMLFPPGH